jgi:hypothetical protein
MLTHRPPGDTPFAPAAAGVRHRIRAPVVELMVDRVNENLQPGHAAVSEICDSDQKELRMGAIAAVLFAIAFFINGTGTSTNAWFSPTSLMLAGLTCLALHLLGVGTGWYARRR